MQYGKKTSACGKTRWKGDVNTMKTATSVLFLCIQIQQLKRENDLQLQKNERQNYKQTQQLRPTDTATERQNDLQIQHMNDKTTYKYT